MSGISVGRGKKMDLFKALKDTFKVEKTAEKAEPQSASASGTSAVSAMYAESAEARRIHERNAAFLRGLSGENPQQAETVAKPETGTRSERLLNVLKSQDEILNTILKEQGKLHKNVKKRKWDDLEQNLAVIKNLSDNFVELDEKREQIVGDDRKIYYENGIEEVFYNLRTKLAKSKIENEALRTYVSTTREFIGNVLEECSKHDTSTYGQDGSKVKREVGSMLVNIEL